MTSGRSYLEGVDELGARCSPRTSLSSKSSRGWREDWVTFSIFYLLSGGGACVVMCRWGQRTACQSQFSPSPMKVQRSNSSPQAWQQVPLPSLRVIFDFCITCDWTHLSFRDKGWSWTPVQGTNMFILWEVSTHQRLSVQAPSHA